MQIICTALIPWILTQDLTNKNKDIADRKMSNEGKYNKMHAMYSWFSFLFLKMARIFTQILNIKLKETNQASVLVSVTGNLTAKITHMQNKNKKQPS